MSSTLVLRQMAGRRTARRQQAALLSEVFAANPADAAVAGFVLASVGKAAQPILWVQDRMSRGEAGCPYLPGLDLAAPLLRVDIGRPADVLTAMEDGLRCKGLAAVIGEVWGDHPALSFAATKRLAIRAEAAKLPCWLIRRAAVPNLSAARERWRVASLPSAPHPDDPVAPGAPRWRAELFRSRFSQPGEWVAHYDSASGRLDLYAPLPDGAVASPRAKDEQRAAG